MATPIRPAQFLELWQGHSTAWRPSRSAARGPAEPRGDRCAAIALAHRSRRGIHLPDLIGTEQFLTRKEGESFESFATTVTRTTGEQGTDDILSDDIL